MKIVMESVIKTVTRDKICHFGDFWCDISKGKCDKCRCLEELSLGGRWWEAQLRRVPQHLPRTMEWEDASTSQHVGNSTESACGWQRALVEYFTQY